MDEYYNISLVLKLRRLLHSLRTDGNEEKEHLVSSNKVLAQPPKVATAVKLLYATLGIGIIRSMMEAPSQAEAGSVGLVLFILFSVLGLMWFFIYMIGRGRNWARITFFLMFILGVPLSILPMIQSLAHDPVSGILGLVQIFMQIIAMLFLFHGSSSAWFKALKQSKIEKD